MRLSDLTPLQSRVYAVLEECAEKGAPLPVYSDIPAIVGCKMGSFANAVSSLERFNFIKTLHDAGEKTRRRRIQIVRTGKCTAKPTGWVEPDQRPRSRIEAVPCFRCGCKSDSCECRG